MTVTRSHAASDAETVARARRWLARCARRLSTDADVAEDLVQETILVALRHDRLSDDELDRRWMAHVLRNALRMRLRGERRRAGREAAVVADGGAHVDASDHLVFAEQVAWLRRALGRMREPFHSTLRMRYFDEEEPTEIARRLGVPASTVRRRHQLAIAELRRALGPGVTTEVARAPAPQARGVVAPSATDP